MCLERLLFYSCDKRPAPGPAALPALLSAGRDVPPLGAERAQRLGFLFRATDLVITESLRVTYAAKAHLTEFASCARKRSFSRADGAKDRTADQLQPLRNGGCGVCWCEGHCCPTPKPFSKGAGLGRAAPRAPRPPGPKPRPRLAEWEVGGQHQRTLSEGPPGHTKAAKQRLWNSWRGTAPPGTWQRAAAILEISPHIIKPETEFIRICGSMRQCTTK